MRSRPRVASTGEFESFEERKSLGDREHDENSAQGRELAVGLKPPLLPRLRRRASDDGESLHRQRRSFELLVPQGTGRPPRVEIVGSIPRLVHADPRTSGRRSERSLPGLGSSKKRGAVPDYTRAPAGAIRSLTWLQTRIRGERQNEVFVHRLRGGQAPVARPAERF